jgi:hypothetical protein
LFALLPRLLLALLFPRPLFALLFDPVRPLLLPVVPRLFPVAPFAVPGRPVVPPREVLDPPLLPGLPLLELPLGLPDDDPDGLPVLPCDVLPPEECEVWAGLLWGLAAGADLCLSSPHPGTEIASKKMASANKVGK